MNTINIFTTNYTRSLAENVVDTINKENTFEKIKLGECIIDYFANKEISCQYTSSIRDKKIYIFGHTGTFEIMELLLMIDAAKRASAKQIIVIIPCYGYGRQDKKEGVRGPIGAKLVAKLLETSGSSNIISIELHSESIQGFFDIPFNHINGFAIFKDTISAIVKNHEDEYVIVSPDAGGAIRAKIYAKKFGLNMAVMNKERSKPGEIAKISLVGDVSKKHIIICDDLIDSGNTLCKASDYLIYEKNVASVNVICPHGVFSGNAIDKLNNTESLSNVYISDTLSLPKALLDKPKFKIVSSSLILAKIIGQTYKGESINEINS